MRVQEDARRLVRERGRQELAEVGRRPRLGGAHRGGPGTSAPHAGVQARAPRARRWRVEEIVGPEPILPAVGGRALVPRLQPMKGAAHLGREPREVVAERVPNAPHREWGEARREVGLASGAALGQRARERDAAREVEQLAEVRGRIAVDRAVAADRRSSLDPIVEAGFRCGTGDIALLFFGVPMVFGGAATSFLVARKVLGGAASPSRSVWGWLRFAAWLAGLLLVVGAAERRLTHPAPSAYLDALPVVAVFPTPSSVRCIDERQPAGNTRCISPAREIGPLSATFECPTDAKRDCRVDVTVRSADPLADGHPTDLDVGRDESLVVRRDSAEHLYLIESGGVARRAVRDDGALVFFLRPSDVGHALGAPTEWMGLGAAALVLAAALAWLARRRQDRAEVELTPGTSPTCCRTGSP